VGNPVFQRNRLKRGQSKPWPKRCRYEMININEHLFSGNSGEEKSFPE
jgi:hypothetical protein